MGRRTPDNRPISVLLPEPFGPTRPTISPASTRSDTPSRARTPPYRLVRSVHTMTGAPAACDAPAWHRWLGRRQGRGRSVRRGRWCGRRRWRRGSPGERHERDDASTDQATGDPVDESVAPAGDRQDRERDDEREQDRDDPSAHPREQAIGCQDDEDDEDGAEDDQAPALETGRGQAVLERDDDDRADQRAGPVVTSAEDAHDDDEQRDRQAEHALHRHEPDLEGVDRSSETADEPGQADRQHLGAEGRDTEAFRDVLRIADREQRPAGPGVLDEERGEQGPRGDGEDQQVEEFLKAADHLRDVRGGDHDPLAAVDRRHGPCGRGEDERDREGQQGEDLAAQRAKAECERADGERQDRRQDPAYRQRGEERPVLPADQHRRRVGADPDIRCLAEREVAAVAGQDVPARRLGRPEEDRGEEDQVERREAERVAQERQGRQRDERDREADDTPADHARRLENTPLGRSTSAMMTALKMTSGAAAGERTTDTTPDTAPTIVPARRSRSRRRCHRGSRRRRRPRPTRMGPSG